MDSKQPTMADVLNHESDLSKGDALKICADHLKGLWAEITEDQMDMRILQGGFVNRLYVCENQKVTSGSQEVKHVILRLYGGKMVDKSENAFKAYGEVGEVLVYYIMAQEGLGPQIYGVFSGGRVEQYLPSRIISNDDLLDPAVTSAFARKLARIHSLSVPFSKEPKDMFSMPHKVAQWILPPFKEGLKQQPVPKGSEGAAQLVQSFNLSQVLEFVTKTLPLVKHRVVFCHNDMNRANCLLKNEGKDADEKVVLVDYEFTCYNYRGCDLGSHFKSREVDVTKMAQEMKEGGIASGLVYPSEDERRHFIRAYLAEVSRVGAIPFDPELDNEDNLLLESEFFGLVYQVFFLSWVIHDSGKWKDTGFTGNAFFNVFLFLAGNIKGIFDRMQTVKQLMGTE